MATTTALPVPVTTEDAITTFVTKAKEDPAFEEYLTASLVAAHEEADRTLNRALYNALTWPRDLPAYVDYLTEFGRWIPQQSSDPA